jgi:hypothetical protein
MSELDDKMGDLEGRLRSEFGVLRQGLDVSAPDSAKIFGRQRSRRWLHRPLGVLLGAGLVFGGSAGIAIALTTSHMSTAPTTTTSVVPSTTTPPPTTTTTPPQDLPAAPNCDPQLGGSGFEPTSIFIGCATSADNLVNIVWSTWTATNSTGTATHNINDCQPDCAGGTFSGFPVEVTLSDPAMLNGVYVFTTITMTPTTTSGSRESATNVPCVSGPSGTCSSSGPDWGFVPNSQ